MWELTSEQVEVRALHRLPSRRGPPEAPHLHLWTIQLVVSADALDESGFVVDCNWLNPALRALLAPLEGTCLEESALFAGQPASAERFAELVFLALAPAIDDGRARLAAVHVSKDRSCRATRKAAGFTA